MSTRRFAPAKVMAAMVGLAIVLTPATLASAAKKVPAKKTCALKKKAKCKKAKLTKVKVGKVNLTGTDLAGATISGATFTGTNLTNVNLSGARITDTTFSGVQVGGLALTGATLSGVRFVNASVGAPGATESSSGLQRAQECSAVDPTGNVFGTPLAFTCTGGGIDFRDSKILNRNATFLFSTIPRSDFRGVTAGGGILSFEASDVSESNFLGARVPLSFMAGRRTKDSGWVWSTARGSVFDGTTIAYLSGTDATNASFLTALMPSSKDGKFDGARGLLGAATVTVAGSNGSTPPGLRTIQIREDGYFRPGILCTSAPCTRASVAVGAPVVATAAGTLPLVLAMPGWQCAADDPAVVDGVTVYRSSCSVAQLPAGNVSGTVSLAPSPPVQVSVAADSGVAGSASPVSHISLAVRAPGSGADETIACTDASTCTADVTPGSTVALHAQDATRVLSVKCPGETGLRMAPAGSELACPAQVITAATSVRLAAQMGAALNITAVDSGNWALATPISTLRVRVRPASFSVGATTNCDARSACSVSIPLGSAVQVTIGDSALDTSGFCPGPGATFYFRLPGVPGVCPEYTFNAAENFRIETAPPG